MSDAPAAPSKAKTFLRRLISSLILWVVVIGALFSGNMALSRAVCIFLLLFLALSGLTEFYGLAEKRGLFCFKWCGLFGTVLL
ncbi:MAG TPA: hypothetical protein VN516_03490, partial [Candidatus Baltobacteraceae bacterium]|nr:hypothetical protein [Candidatus Baltobacteraceae bacterium]